MFFTMKEQYFGYLCHEEKMLDVDSLVFLQVIKYSQEFLKLVVLPNVIFFFF